MYTPDTIAAVATGSGRAGVGIIRISGPAVPDIARQLTGKTLSARHAHYLAFLDSTGRTLDEGLALRFDAPNSYTGEAVLELQGHGGPVVLDMVLQRVLDCGARMARPGEFTERAFLNDRMDLAQAEAVADLIDASSQAAAQAAIRSLDGEFSQAVNAISEELMSLRAWLEAALDFSEEEIDFLSDPVFKGRVTALLHEFDSVFARATQGSRLTDGLTVVIAGVANVGKSSLLNALSGTDRAIVTDIAGTTRDVLHEHITLDGIPLHLMDTAGMRLTDDVVEQQGIDRAEQALASADHVLILVDASQPVLPDTSRLAKLSAPSTLLINKMDAVDTSSKSALEESAERFKHETGANEVLYLSIKADQGLDELRMHLMQMAGRDTAVEGVFSARRRHLDALQRSREATDAALQRLNHGEMPELAAEELRLARSALDEVTGRFDTEDLLGKVFGQFCIGK